MRLYLVQHGEAVSETVDRERPLSPEGLRDASSLAAACRAHGLRAAEVLHSGKLRARQTAEELAAVLSLSLRQASGIDPLSPVGPFAGECAAWSEDRIIVGHMPFLGRLASLLLAEREDPPVVAFQRAGMVCLEKQGPREWCMLWTCFPKQPHLGA